MKEPTVSLEQWYIFKIVVEQGSFQGAADYLIKSQSSISYAIQKLQDNLGVRLFEQQGRRAVVTDMGKKMLIQADELLMQAASIEQLAGEYSAGWEPLLKVMTTQLFPQQLLTDVLVLFAQQCTVTSIDFQQGTLSGVTDAATYGTADLIISSQIPTGFTGEKLCPAQLSRFVHHQHPLALLNRPLTLAELKSHAQIVMSDSSSLRSVDAGWLGSQQRWTVNNFQESLSLVKQRLGHATLPVNRIQDELANGELVELIIEDHVRLDLSLYLVYANKKTLGVAGLLFAKLLKQQAKQYVIDI
ncbi:LysR family transcriptional regulator [Moritella yayanosii]|uniref:Putative transcriptional regulator with periplasmic binding proteindomain (LysR family) n=1 Tax=Moritella yayanosii TaxID=69539 RepID=A0A330LVP8_9GAMM|nr:LysR family transcriptional regulator [Moritella yayanosii]SQD80753.1 putative transcriptional regulator with periplasmic binding proteindomain (LysR family) [Moritella yayanosii]